MARRSEGVEMGPAVPPASRALARDIEFLDRIDYRLAETDEDKDAIYPLRYRAYRHEGAIGPLSDHKLTDRFDDAPNCWTFGVYVDDSLVSSLRISLATPANADTPAVDAFGAFLEPELAQGKTIVDPNRFVADRGRAQKIPKLPYMTLRLPYRACTHFTCRIGTA